MGFVADFRFLLGRPDALQATAEGGPPESLDGRRTRLLFAGLVGVQVVLQRDHHGQPIHVLWGIPANAASPAVVVTAYRPDPNRWKENFLGRKS